MHKYLLLLTIVFRVIAPTNAQIPTGEWRDHLPYNTAHTVAIGEDKVFCAAEHVMFYFDKTDNSINRMSKSTGLSDLGIGSIAYSDAFKCLIVGYENGNLDVIKNGKVLNVCDIKDKNIIADKKINHIAIYNDIAYLSCGFGIVVFDIANLEIDDTYIIGENSTYMPINQTILYNDYIFALTDHGLYKADADDPFLGYYEKWQTDTTLFDYTDNFISATVAFDRLFVTNAVKSTIDSSRVQSFNGLEWTTVFDTLINIRSLSSSNNELIIPNSWEVSVFNEQLQKTDRYPAAFSQHALFDEEHHIWIADEQKGLIKNSKSMFPNSPVSDRVFEIVCNNDEILVAPGGYKRTGQNLSFKAEVYTLIDDEWSIIDKNSNPGLDSINDLVCFGIQPGNSSKYYAGTWGYGLIEIDNNKVNGYYNNNNTDNTLGRFISGLAFDNSGNLWIVNRNVEKPFVVKTTDNSWYSYSYGGEWSNIQTDKVIYTRNGNFWTTSIRGEGYFVWNTNGTPETDADDVYIKRKLINSEGAIIDDVLNDIVEDAEGAIWIASSDGVAVYDNPQEVFETTGFYARRPQIVVDGYLKPLLEGENVTAIAVDGANRKWLGTDGGGLFLVSQDGTKQIQIFNSTNSPLLSNNIISLELNKKNGELFIGTDKGIMSYMTTSSESNTSYSNIYAFPNPVKGDYNGLITIRGLMYETDVKITDLSGNLVYNTISNGGDAIWNGKDLEGKPVSSGVYLVLCTNPDGSEAEATKIVIVR